MSKSEVFLPLSRDKKGTLSVVGLGASTSVVAFQTPVLAQAAPTSPIDSVSAMITSLGGIAAAVTVVVLGAMGVRMAIKLVNRVGVKG